MGTHRLSKVRVKLQHVVELLLQRGRLQSFVLVVLQKVGLRKEVFMGCQRPSVIRGGLRQEVEGSVYELMRQKSEIRNLRKTTAVRH